ncbi:MAG TPA: NAD(P)/FAD-dependent oxidoreductase [Candidatus Limadaptatus stercorigallinarum]|uniref:NAD(P)/FAD-dependent oxidoreductase n=1 Tax=Candidatus Limadaptatus stercorigallinarum TaxID=2840845 RepID=A0A9D1L2K4_9FIRM|nr:NAD(P)/FAD-dependent oxidoreductase [Candidatus Limadaptatus stercorigallinarum]
MSTVIVGGGASGAMCAVLAARRGESVTLLEKNEKTGKKLFITGKGRCNLTADRPPAEFLAGVVRGEKFLRSAVWSFTPEDTKAFFEEEGVPLVTERGNRVFPASGKSSDITRALDRALKESGVRVELHSEAVKTERRADCFVVTLSDGRELCSDNLVIATGGKSYPSTGSTGDGYRFAESFGHSVVKPVPSLAQLLVKDSVAELNGISLKNVTLSAELPGGKTFSEFGEMLFTKRGLSGPIALSLSARLNRTAGAVLRLDLKPALSREKLDARVLRDFAERQNSDLKNVTRALLPERLNAYVLSRAGLDATEKVNSVTREQRERLVGTLKDLTFRFSSVAPFEEAVVTSGGVELKELTPKCESRLVKGLYFIGEVIDADAYTGGYNLQIAFSTAVAAAADITSKRSGSV